MLRSFCSNLILMFLITGTISAAEKPNILFIAVDDLRPELACYGAEQIHSPNIDRLADSGVLFERAYCMVPTCGASRASLMTGIRPTPDRFKNYLTRADHDTPGIKTLNTHFKDHGYFTLSLGKVFHHAEDNAQGWSEPAVRWNDVSMWQDPANQKLHQERQKLGPKSRGPAWEAADVPDDAYIDGKLANRAIKDLQRLSKQQEPFYLAVGFYKPHLPFNAPRKYWDLYDQNQIKLPKNYYVPEDAPAESIHNSGELRAYSNIPKTGPVSDETARNLIHGYYACVSYTDAQIGKVLDELDRLGLAENTIVVLWGDHGWNLGEHTLWCKHSCYETSLQIPLIVRAPGMKGESAHSAD
ncbi:MAG: sulfatase [Planctomycetaceae bacterium]